MNKYILFVQHKGRVAPYWRVFAVLFSSPQDAAREGENQIYQNGALAYRYHSIPSLDMDMTTWLRAVGNRTKGGYERFPS